MIARLGDKLVKAMNNRATYNLPEGYEPLTAIRRKSDNLFGYAVIAAAVNLSNVKKIVANMRIIINATYGVMTATCALPMDKFTNINNEAPEITWPSANPTIPLANMIGDTYKTVELSFNNPLTPGNANYTYTTLFSWRSQNLWTPKMGFTNIKIFNWNDEVAAEFIPCKETSTGFIGYYERVQGIFRTSAYPGQTVGNCYWEEDSGYRLSDEILSLKVKEN